MLFHSFFNHQKKPVLLLLFLLTSSPLFHACDSGGSQKKKPDPSQQVTLYGQVVNPAPGEIKLRKINNKTTSETYRIKLNPDNSFRKTVFISNPEFFEIDFYGLQKVVVILDKKDVEIRANLSTNQFEIIGSPDSDLVQTVHSMMNTRDLPKVKNLEAQFQTAMLKFNQSEVDRIQNEMQKIIDSVSQEVANYLEKQPPSLGLIHVLRSNILPDKDRYFNLYQSVAKKMMHEYPNSLHARDFSNYVEQLKKTAIGQPAPEIALPDPNGKIIKLSSFRGKYVLVDFWAQWCGPCRQENPNVVKAYHQFKDKKFDIYGVSLDQKKSDWLRAIQEDGLVWAQVSDLKSFNSQVVADYHVEGIPFSVLVDPKGIIIAKNLRGQALSEKLKEVLN